MKTAYRLSGKQVTEPYSWGAGCSAWVLQESGNVIVKEESMPAGASEQLHFHKQMEQFFYILDGVATFLIEGEQVVVHSSSGITIPKNTKHLITNSSVSVLRFLVISTPGVPDDRTNID